MKRLLLVVGSEKHWAIANRVKNLTPHLSKHYDVSVFAGYNTPPNLSTFDIVHTHRPSTVGADRNLASHRCWGLELVSRRTWEKTVRLGILPRAKFIVGKNADLSELALRATKCPNTVTIPNGVDASVFHPPICLVGWVGNKRFNNPEYKGVEIIRAACELFNKKYGSYLQVKFVQDPSDYPRLILPPEQIADFYRMLSVYVCASLGEGSSNPVLEAVATGIPVVTTKVGNWNMKGLREHLIPVERTPATIAEGIAQALRPRLLARIAVVNEMSWAKIASRYLDLYDKLC